VFDVNVMVPRLSPATCNRGVPEVCPVLLVTVNNASRVSFACRLNVDVDGVTMRLAGTSLASIAVFPSGRSMGKTVPHDATHHSKVMLDLF